MRTTHLGAAHVRPGKVTAWVPSATTMAALRRSPNDPRPLTVDQEHHLRASTGRARHDSAEAPWIGLSCQLERGTPDAVAAALASLFDRHESLRCDYDPHGDGFSRRLLEAGAVEMEPLPLGDRLDAGEAHAAVIEHLSTHAQPHVWPRAGFVTVEDEARVTLYAAFDHVTFDLASLHACVDELAVMHRAYVRGDGPDPSLARPASHLDHAAAERERLADITPCDPRLLPWRDLVRDGQLPGLPSSSGIGRGQRWGHDIVSMPLATLGETAELEELAGSWGVSLETALVALLLRSIAAQEGVAPYDVSAVLAVPGRTPAQATALGWFAAVVPLRVEVDPTAELCRVAKDAETARRASVAQGTLPLPVVGRLLGVPVEPSLVLAFVDHRSTPGLAAARINRASGYLGHVPAGDQVHAWITCLPEGTFLEARHPATAECAGWVATLAVGVRRALLAELNPRPVFASAPG